MNDDREIASALESARNIAVVGCSPNPLRPSNVIARYLKDRGYRVIPVNPGHREMLGEKCYRSILEIPREVRIDVVDVFRRSSEVGKVAQEAIARGVGFFFMQQGVADEEAAARLEAAGIPVAMDRCILIERERLALLPLPPGEGRGEGSAPSPSGRGPG